MSNLLQYIPEDMMKDKLAVILKSFDFTYTEEVVQPISNTGTEAEVLYDDIILAKSANGPTLVKAKRISKKLFLIGRVNIDELNHKELINIWKSIIKILMRSGTDPQKVALVAA